MQKTGIPRIHGRFGIELTKVLKENHITATSVVVMAGMNRGYFFDIKMAEKSTA